MFVLVTDFGGAGPYVAQMRSVLAQSCPDVPCIELFSDLPAFDIQAAAYLLPAYIENFPEGAVFICVVDPGVGGDRGALIVRAFDRFFVGPDNGLLEMICRRDPQAEVSSIAWQDEAVSRTFHGRDVFAPVAIKIMCGGEIANNELHAHRRDEVVWPDELWQVIYIDHYGNAVTGVRAKAVDSSAVFKVAERKLRFAPTFSAVNKGELFWYVNANGLVEFAVNQGRADLYPGIAIGTKFSAA